MNALKRNPRSKKGMKLLGIGFRPQTYGQWYATFKGCLGTKYHPATLAADPSDARIEMMFRHDMRASNAAHQWKKFFDADPDIVPLKLAMGKVQKPKRGGRRR